MQNAVEYFTQLCKDAGLDETTTSAILNAAKHEKLSERLNSLVKPATEDYNAQLGRVKAADDKLKEYGTWYGTASTQYQQMQEELVKAKKQLSALVTGDGNPGTNGNGSGEEPKYLTAADLAAYDKERSARLASVVKETSRLASRHASAWHEELNVDELDKIATERNCSLSDAYDQWMKPP